MNKKGFTLVELLLYLGLAAAMLLAVSVFLSVIMQSRIKNQTVAEVEQQGWQIMQLMTQTIRNSEAINSPSAGGTASTLSLQQTSAPVNPTIFDLSGTTIRITEGTGSPIDLNSTKVEVSALNIENLSRTNTSGNIRIWFTASHINPGSRKEYDYTKTFYGSASLR
jgi:Tfp pilus assembly protein PilW